MTAKRRILEIGNWPPPVCGWSMGLVGLRRELEARGWECRVMNLNENRRVSSPEYIDVQNGWDYLRKLLGCVRDSCAVHARVNAESLNGYILAFLALLAARLWRRPALLTYAGGHQQSYFPAPRFSLRHQAFSLLFRLSDRVYCNNEAVRRVLLGTGIPSERVVPIPHTSPYYLEFSPTLLPQELEEFWNRHEGVFFSYVCFRKEYALEFYAEAIRRICALFPHVGFIWVGPGERELSSMREFVHTQKIKDAVFVMGSVPHDLFLTLLSRSLAYIRIPVTDGVCSSVLESLKLEIPVLAADNGTRPEGTERWEAGNLDSLLRLMTQVLRNREELVERIPEITLEDNAKRLVDDIETITIGSSLPPAAATPHSKELSAGHSHD